MENEMTAERSTVLVTGGSRGIGAAIVRMAAREGFDVAFTYASRHDAAAALVAEVEAGGGLAIASRADAADVAALTALVDGLPAGFGPWCALVNNAGITGRLGAFLEASEASMRRILEVNVLGTLLASQLAARRWSERSVRGSIVNISSIAATLGAPGEYVDYAASKAAVETFTVGLARELAATGIRVNAVSPGTTLTDIHATAGDPGRPERVAARIPMGRPATPEEIAEAVLWLLSSRASYVTGSILKVAGGL